MTQEALKLALEALEELHAMVWGECPSLLNEDSGGDSTLDMECKQAITAIKEALAQQQEPVAMRWLAEMIMSDCGCSTNNERLLERVMDRIDQYERANTPPQRTWVGLTEERVKEIWLKGKDHGDDWTDVLALARSFEAELKGLNT